MSALFWMVSTADPRCGYEGVLPEEAYYSDPYIKTSDFFSKRTGSPGTWTLIFEKLPCDIARTPFKPIFSKRFIELAESLGAHAKYYPVDIKVGEKLIKNKYFFAVPDNIVSAIDRSSPRVRITDINSRTPNWIESFSHQKSYINYSLVGNHHWSQEKDTFGLGWTISETFKDAIEKNKLTGFNFFEAKPSPNT